MQDIDYKIVVDQPEIEGLTREDEIFEIGFSFGNTASYEERQKSIGTIRVETKLCHLAYLDPIDLAFVINKQRLKKEEKMLNIVKSLPYFKGVTRNTALRIAGFLEKKKPCLN